MSSPYPADSLTRVQAIERDILREVDALCRKHHIDYFINSGTALGAKRHGGFIPWDDDIDIGMLPQDFEKFMQVAAHELPEGYSLHTSANTPGYFALWPKVFKDNTRFVDEVAAEAGCDQGIFIDVFPYIVLDQDEAIAKRQIRRAILCQNKCYLHFLAHPKIPSTAPLYRLKRAACWLVHYTIARLWNPVKLQKAFDQTLETDHPSSRIVNAAYAYSCVLERGDIFPTRDIAFDDIEVRAPHDIERYLEKEYGNYMQLPPENERYTHAPVVLDLGDGRNVMEDSRS